MEFTPHPGPAHSLKPPRREHVLPLHGQVRPVRPQVGIQGEPLPLRTVNTYMTNDRPRGMGNLIGYRIGTGPMPRV
jgi:hypothetical protein